MRKQAQRAEALVRRREPEVEAEATAAREAERKATATQAATEAYLKVVPLALDDGFATLPAQHGETGKLNKGLAFVAGSRVAEVSAATKAARPPLRHALTRLWQGAADAAKAAARGSPAGRAPWRGGGRSS